MNAEVRLEVEPEFNRALSLWHSGEPQAALNILHRLDADYPHQPAILGMTGGIYFDAEDYGRAREYYGKTVQLSPKSELASLGLFHSLWRVGERDAAFDEVKRFLCVADSEEYRRLISEMNEEITERDDSDYE